VNKNNIILHYNFSHLWRRFTRNVYGPFSFQSHFKTRLQRYLYLIVPFWYASAAYQVSLGRAMVRILARRSQAKIPMARPNEPDMPPKRTKKVRLGIYRTQIRM